MVNGKARSNPGALVSLFAECAGWMVIQQQFITFMELIALHYYSSFEINTDCDDTDSSATTTQIGFVDHNTDSIATDCDDTDSIANTDSSLTQIRSQLT